jgi:hypothetical protein
MYKKIDRKWELEQEITRKQEQISQINVRIVEERWRGLEILTEKEKLNVQVP